MSYFYKNFKFIVIITLFLISCSNDDMQGVNTPQIHDAIDIDVDGNGEFDFKIYSTQQRNFLAYITTQISPWWSLDTKLLTKIEDIPSTSVLELNEITEVTDAEPPFYWRNDSALLMTIYEAGPFGVWNPEWTIKASNPNKESYFVHVKLAYDDGSERLGWIQLHCNKLTGRVTVLNKGMIN